MSGALSAAATQSPEASTRDPHDYSARAAPPARLRRTCAFHAQVRRSQALALRRSRVRGDRRVLIPAALDRAGRQPVPHDLVPESEPHDLDALRDACLTDGVRDGGQTLFGALAVVAIYLCGLALFARQSAAIAA